MRPSQTTYPREGPSRGLDSLLLRGNWVLISRLGSGVHRRRRAIDTEANRRMGVGPTEGCIYKAILRVQ